MRRYNTLTVQTAKRYNPLLPKGQAYDTLLLPAAGDITWTALNHIVATYKLDADFGFFALISWPATALPLFVRDNQTRYKLNDSDPAQAIYSVEYAGQVLSAAAVFEVWNSGSSPTTFPEYELTISYRTQLCCCDESEGVQHTANLTLPACESYPVCLPICS